MTPVSVCENSEYIGDLETDSSYLILAIGRLKLNPTLVNTKTTIRHAMMSAGLMAEMTMRI